ncbi:MAG: hypothetical protein ACTSQP_06235 [Promethearchaeota archaeon]
MDKRERDIAKLMKLLSHWAEHNESHKEAYLKWMNIAKNYGLNEIVEKIDKAISMMDKSTEFLLEAEKILRNLE